MGDEPRTDGDIARLGLEAAAAVVERMLEMGRAAAGGFRVGLPPNVGPPGDGGSARSGDQTGDGSTAVDLGALSRQLRADSERLIEQYASWTRALVEGAVGLVEGSSQSTSAAPVEVVRLGPAAAGMTTGTTLWLHVLDGPCAPPAELVATDLVAHTGAIVPGSAVHCDPATVSTEEARSTTEVAVAVEVPAGTEPGAYHGHLLARGLAEVVLALRLEVVA